MIDNKDRLIPCRIVIANGKIRTVTKGISESCGINNQTRSQTPVLLPGLVNLHTHLELPPLLDSIRAETLPDWVLNLIKAKRRLQQEDYATAAEMNIQTCLSTGTTTIGEICTHGASPALLRQSGLRSVVFREIISMDPQSPLPNFRKLVPRSSHLIYNGLSPHAPQTVSDRVLRQVRFYSSKNRTKLCMHVAESPEEIKLLQGKKNGYEELYRKAGWDTAWAPKASSPFSYLADLGLLDPHFLAVHAVYATEDDIRLLKKKRVPVAHCPRSNRETGVGRMKLRRFLDSGITVGLGTDSLASSPSLSLWDEMRFAYRVHMRDGVSAKEIFQMATIGGAKAIGMEQEIGSLDPGKRADIIAVSLPSQMTGDIYSDLLRETNSCMMTMVNGKVLFRSR